MSISNAVILNSKDHSIADLPAEIIENIFQDVRGRDLIKLTTVCKAFNETIGNSAKLMNNIRLRIDSKKESHTNVELENMLQSSGRDYCHISLKNTIYGDDVCTNFFTNFPVWKSIKLISGSFESFGSAENFLKRISDHLEEIEYEGMRIISGDQTQGLRVKLPRLLKLKCRFLPTSGLACTKLKMLNLMDCNNDIVHTTLLKSNPDVKDLTATFDVLQSISRPDIIEIGTQLRLTKFHVTMHTSNISDNIPIFLKTQADCLEDVQMEWTEHGKTDQTTSAEVLGIIFRDFTGIRKLTLSNKCGSDCNFATSFSIVPNYKITELRLRLYNTPEWNGVLEKIVKACPSVKNLFVHKMDQKLLEMCSNEMRLVESIFAFSFHVDQLPHEAIKFAHLSSISFCECTIKNRPDLKGRPVNLKAIVMKLLKKQD